MKDLDACNRRITRRDRERRLVSSGTYILGHLGLDFSSENPYLGYSLDIGCLDNFTVSVKTPCEPKLLNKVTFKQNLLCCFVFIRFCVQETTSQIYVVPIRV